MTVELRPLGGTQLGRHSPSQQRDRRQAAVMREWLKSMERIGVRSARLHLLEVDHEDIRSRYTLSPEENLEALKSFGELELSLTTLPQEDGEMPCSSRVARTTST